MSSGDTLVDFVTWAAQNYPADKYVLILSDHGMGWPGGWSDPDPGRQGQQVDRQVPLEAAIGDNLFLNELDAALAKARQQAGIDKFELIGLDACLMGHVEVMDALAPHGRYAVFSQETEPSLGWAYTAFLSSLAQNPDAGRRGAWPRRSSRATSTRTSASSTTRRATTGSAAATRSTAAPASSRCAES